MVDAADLKSAVRKDVRVRIPPPAPSLPQFPSLTCDAVDTAALPELTHVIRVSSQTEHRRFC
jgi:hypothetical protein